MKEHSTIEALVIEEQKGSYTIHAGGRELPAVLTGKMLGEAASRLDLPVVGDRVLAELLDGGERAVIRGLLPRASVLLRRELGGGRDAQPFAANVAKVVIVMGLDGNYNLARLERLLVAAWDSGAAPVVALTKSDLCPPEELAAREAAARGSAPGAEVFLVSSVSGEGVDRLAASLAGARCCFVGSSGAGKSTLLNRLAGREAAATGEVRESDSRGRHTTTSRQLYFLPGGIEVIDTPGVREFALEAGDGGLESSFSDIAELAAGCRFTDCSHSGEPGCAVSAAIEAGRLAPERLKSYGKLRRETERLERRDDPKKRMLAKLKLKRFGRAQRDIGENKRRLRGG